MSAPAKNPLASSRTGLDKHAKLVQPLAASRPQAGSAGDAAGTGLEPAGWQAEKLGRLDAATRLVGNAEQNCGMKLSSEEQRQAVISRLTERVDQTTLWEEAHNLEVPRAIGSSRDWGRLIDRLTNLSSLRFDQAGQARDLRPRALVFPAGPGPALVVFDLGQVDEYRQAGWRVQPAGLPCEPASRLGELERREEAGVAVLYELGPDGQAEPVGGLAFWAGRLGKGSMVELFA